MCKASRLPRPETKLGNLLTHLHDASCVCKHSLRTAQGSGLHNASTQGLNRKDEAVLPIHFEPRDLSHVWHGNPRCPACVVGGMPGRGDNKARPELLLCRLSHAELCPMLEERKPRNITNKFYESCGLVSRYAWLHGVCPDCATWGPNPRCVVALFGALATQLRPAAARHIEMACSS